jgi:hypothetical protein
MCQVPSVPSSIFAPDPGYEGHLVSKRDLLRSTPLRTHNSLLNDFVIDSERFLSVPGGVTGPPLASHQNAPVDRNYLACDEARSGAEEKGDYRDEIPLHVAEFSVDRHAFDKV